MWLVTAQHVRAQSWQNQRDICWQCPETFIDVFAVVHQRPCAGCCCQVPQQHQQQSHINDSTSRFQSRETGIEGETSNKMYLLRLLQFSILIYVASDSNPLVLGLGFDHHIHDPDACIKNLSIYLLKRSNLYRVCRAWNVMVSGKNCKCRQYGLKRTLWFQRTV